MDHREHRAPEEQWAALAQVTSVAEAQKIAGRRFETKGQFAGRMLQEIHIQAQQRLPIPLPADDTDRQVLEETGLPGTVRQVGGTRYIIHGVPHPVGALHSTIEQYPLAHAVHTWAKSKYEQRLRSQDTANSSLVIMEQNLPAAFGIPQSPLIVYELHDTLDVQREYRWSGVKKWQLGLRQQIDWRKEDKARHQQQTFDQLLPMRRLQRRYMEPLTYLCLEAQFPVYGLERSYLQYAEAVNLAKELEMKTLHLIVGWAHESHLAACFDLYGDENKKLFWNIKKTDIEQKRAEILHHLAGKK